MLASEISKRIEDWLKANAVQEGDKWRCRRCGEIIWGQGKRLPVHETYTLFKGQHSGFGRVEEIVFPYCRKCDKNISHFDDISCIDI
jgi:ribosomal protein L37E